MINRLSCGIVVYDEISELKHLTRSLKNELSNYSVEWVFVLNHEQLEIRQWIKAWLIENISAAICIENPSNNLGFARQLILENATEDYVYMTDPDVEIISGNLIKLIELAENEALIDHPFKNIGFGGTLIYQSTNSFLQKTYDFIFKVAMKIPFSFQIQHHSHIATVDHIPSCHLLLKRKIALKIGGFSHLFSKVGEDLDFSHRAYNEGYLFLFSPASAAFHFQNLTLDKWLYKVFMFGKVQITVQKLNFKKGLRYYRLLPLGFFIAFIAAAIFFLKEILLLVLFPLLLIGLFQASFFGFLITVFIYSFGEFSEIIYPTLGLKNEEELLELKENLHSAIQIAKI